MTQPVLFKQSFLIAVLAGAQAVMPAVVAVASLYATIVFFGIVFDRSSQAIIIVAVLCLILVQPPREVSTQLTSARISAVADVIFRWLLLLGVMLAIGYVTRSLAEYPRRISSCLTSSKRVPARFTAFPWSPCVKPLFTDTAASPNG